MEAILILLVLSNFLLLAFFGIKSIKDDYAKRDKENKVIQQAKKDYAEVLKRPWTLYKSDNPKAYDDLGKALKSFQEINTDWEIPVKKPVLDYAFNTKKVDFEKYSILSINNLKEGENYFNDLWIEFRVLKVNKIIGVVSIIYTGSDAETNLIIDNCLMNKYYKIA